MSLSPSSIIDDLEVETGNEGWDLLEGSKSITGDVTGSAVEVTAAKETPPRDPPETEIEDWYRTIPPTPANTPEYRPAPPAYPSSSFRKTDTPQAADLPPIKEDVAEEVPQNVQTHESNAPSQTPDSLEVEVPSSGDSTFDIVRFGVIRLLIYAIIFGVLKWSVPKVWRKFQNLRAKPQPT